jgi:hypothetical protein
MADNKTKIDRIHDLLPAHFNSKTNENWKALIEAIGEIDQNTANLISEVRKQFFIKTASRPYLDRLASNSKISRPKLVGMDDPSFREYIPVLSYKPKQVKLIIDQLLDIFFSKESTTAFISAQNASTYELQNGWELEYAVDEYYTERIKFSSADFTSISAATADEVVATINRQAKRSYATSSYDYITKNTYIKLFTRTIGAKGSLRVSGGRANIAFRFNGFIDSAGNGSNTQWLVTKIGDTTTFEHVGGTAPGLSNLNIGDVIVSNLPNNSGSFVITSIDIASNKISFLNLFATQGTFTQTSELDVKFIRPNKYVAYSNSRRAMTWETTPGQITVEMPTSPPVVKRSLKGSWHINGVFSNMSNVNSATSLTVTDATLFPESGSFWLEEVQEIQTRLQSPTENTLQSTKQKTRLQGNSQKYFYSDRAVLSTTGNVALGSTQITGLVSTIGIAPGQDVVADGIPGWAKVVSISGSTVDISVSATATATGVTVKFLGNQLNGITPNLPSIAGLNESTLSSLSRTSSAVSATTTTPHGFSVGEYVVVYGCSGVDITTKTGNITSNSNQLTNLSSVSNISPGMLVRMTGVPVGTTVVDIIGSTVIMSISASTTVTGGSVTFSENLNGVYPISTVSTNSLTFQVLGTDGTAVIPGVVRVERIGLSSSGSKVIITDAIINENSRITGAYTWDMTAPFVLSSDKALISQDIKAGKIIRLLQLNNLNTIPNTTGGGYVIFDYGLSTQEGPIKYLYKPTPTTIAIDPSYVFKKPHAVGGSIVRIGQNGPHKISNSAAEYSPYVTDPSEARFILEELIRSVKSAGIFVDFLVRYPEQLYGTLDIYRSGVDPG